MTEHTSTLKPKQERRIAAKVHQLMALADQPDIQLANSRTTGPHLLDAALMKLLFPEGNTRPRPAKAWSRKDRAQTHARNQV